jgi:hypothetical protein
MQHYIEMRLLPGWPLTFLDAIVAANCMGVRLEIRVSDGSAGGLQYQWLNCTYKNIDACDHYVVNLPVGRDKWDLHWNFKTNKFSGVSRSVPAPLNVAGHLEFEPVSYSVSAPFIFDYRVGSFDVAEMFSIR